MTLSNELELDDLAFRFDALCQHVDPEIFFPEQGETAREAKRICQQCVVRIDCLWYAVQHPQEGVWGGMSVRERQHMRH